MLFSHSVMSHSLWPHGLQHTRLPCPSPSPRVYSNSCPSSRWWHPTISPSVVPFSSCPQSFPALGSFLMSQLFASGGQRIGISFSFTFSIRPSNNIQDWFPFRLTGVISLQSKGLWEQSSPTHSSKESILWCLVFFMVQLSHPYITTKKTIALTRQTFAGKVMSHFLNILSRFVISFLPRSKLVEFHGCSHHLQWFWSPEK